ncbi:MAG: hypoxanthine phosphoribosyltransferase [Thermomicrobiales bacterium]
MALAIRRDEIAQAGGRQAGVRKIDGKELCVSGIERRAEGVARVLIEEDAIRERIKVLAREVDDLYPDEPPLMVGVLTGAVTFMADLMRAMSIPVAIDFMAVSSYGASTQTSGIVRILKDLNEEIEGRRVLVVEDIVDSGLTLQYLLDVLMRRNPTDVRVVALLKKEKRSAIDVQVDKVGFAIPDEFVVGYGLDYAGRYRNLPYVAVLDPSVISAK